MISNEDLNARVRVARFAKELDALSRRLDSIERASSASFTSVEGGTLDVYDADGELALSIGVQEDGAAALAYHSLVPPPTPSMPIAEGVIGAIQVTWDGGFTDAGETPSDFARIQIHLLPTAESPVDPATPAATIETATGASYAVATDLYTPQFVRLVAVSRAGVPGAPSEAASAAARKLVGDDLLNGIIDDLKLADDAVTEGKIALGAVKSTAIADGAILEEKLAAAAVTVGKIGQGAVTLNALGGALSDLAAQRYVDAMGDPAVWQVTDSQPGSTWTHLSGITDAPTGQTVGQAKGYVRIRGTTLIAYEPGTVYRISARVRLTAPVPGNEAFYVGALGIGADKVTLVNRQGANNASSHYYVAASGRPIANTEGWVTVVGYLKDRAATGASGSAGPNTDPRAAGLVHADVRFISPYVWCNYLSATTPNSPSVMQVDCVTVEALKTGLVDSTNLVAGSVTAAAIATDAVTAGKIAADAITARELQANSVTAAEIAANAVTAAAIAAGTITTDKLTVVGGANILTDPSFEGPYTAAVAAKTTYATQDKTFGNGSAASLKIDATSATQAFRSVELTLIPVTAGDQLYLATDYYASTTWVGTEINFQARWETADGTIIGYGKASTTTPTKGAWTRLTTTVTAPATATQARIRVESGNGTAGSVWFDNAACRPVVGGTQIADGAITTQKMVANTINGDRITTNTLNASKIVSASITAAQIQALAITGDKIAANTIDATNIKAGAIQAAALAADAITGKTITGGTITGAVVNGSVLRTGASGTRIELVPDDGSTLHDPVLRFFTGSAGETDPAMAHASGSLGYFTLSAPEYGQGTVLVNLATPMNSSDHGYIELYMGQSGGRPNPNLYMDGGTGVISLFAPNSGGGGTGGTSFDFTGKGLTVDTWHTATLNSAQWVPFGSPYGPPAYQERPDGTIDLRGTIKPASGFTPANGGVLFTLPFTFPIQERWDCRSNSTTGTVALTVHTNGQVTTDDIQGTVSWVHLSPIKGIQPT